MLALSTAYELDRCAQAGVKMGFAKVVGSPIPDDTIDRTIR
jgi:hypothetical protein